MAATRKGLPFRAPAFKHVRTTRERIEKFTHNLYFSDVNLVSKLYKITSPVKSILHYAAPDRITYEAALVALYSEAMLGASFGPTWATHWFRVEVVIPSSWIGEEVLFIWNSGSEAMLWEDGRVLTGFSGSDGLREIYMISSRLSPTDRLNRTFYVEMACNTLCGAGSTHFIAPPDPNRRFSLSSCHIAIRDSHVHQLILDLGILHDMSKHLGEGSSRGMEALHVGNHIVNRIQAEGPIAYDECHRLAIEFLSQANGASQHTVHAVGHCHIDTAWLWPYAETIRKCARSWASVFHLMERYPRFTFACSQAQQMEWLKCSYPDLYEVLREYVRNGRFIPVGGTWVEMDGYVPDGESFCRQFLYGQRFFKKEFGKLATVFWLPDTFGYSAQLPQIMKHFGVHRFLTQKLSWNLVNKFPHHTFVWEGIDGTGVLAHFPPGDSYNMSGKVEELIFTVSNFRDKGRSNSSMYLFGHGDGGQGPTEEMIENLTRLKDVDGLPRVEFSTPDQYFEHVEQQDQNNLCRWVGELYLELHNGTYTSQAEVKKNNRLCETVLHNAELLATITNCIQIAFGQPSSTELAAESRNSAAESRNSAAVADQVVAYPSETLVRLWKLLLLNQFHDVLPGSSIAVVYDDARKHHRDILTTANELLKSAAAAIRSSLHAMDNKSRVRSCDEPSQNPSLILWNGLSWSRTEVVELAKEDISELLAVGSFPGSSLVQPIADGGALVIANVPSMGFVDGTALCRLAAVVPQPSTVTETESGDVILQNGLIAARFNRLGHMLSISCCGSSRNPFILTQPANQFVLFDDIPLYWDAWDVMDYHLETRREVNNVLSPIKIISTGPCRASFEVALQLSEQSFIKQLVSLDAGSPYVRFDCQVHWEENRKFLKVEFPTNIRSASATYDIQFGHIQRPTHFNTSWDSAKFEVCGQKWADISEHGFGVSILTDSKYGYATHGGTLRLSLLRSPKCPDDKADIGDHKFSYAAMPHTGSFQAAHVDRYAESLNNPLLCLRVPVCQAVQVSGSRSFFSVDNPAIVIDAVKKAEDSDSVILRLHENHGGQCTAVVSVGFPFVSVKETNGLEEDLGSAATVADCHVGEEGGWFRVTVCAFQLKSYALRIGGCVRTPPAAGSYDATSI